MNQGYEENILAFTKLQELVFYTRLRYVSHYFDEIPQSDSTKRNGFFLWMNDFFTWWFSGTSPIVPVLHSHNTMAYF